uniref:extracellular calcium-sensing receptor-like n=1 Tax=Myxine glutinosa TaxID=7769 RepID=UPI00358FFF29
MSLYYPVATRMLCPPLSGHFAVAKAGDVVLAGLFTIHDIERKGVASFREKPEFTGCTGMLMRALRRMLTMMFAIEEINQSTEVLPNITLGYLIYDVCRTMHTTLDATLNFLQEMIDNDVDFNCKPSAVIGPSQSGISSAVAQFLGLFYIPQISYSSSCKCLSDKKKFPSFLRTIPSDSFQAFAVAKLVNYFAWLYVGTIEVSRDYGRVAIDQFTSEAEKSGICIAFREILPAAKDIEGLTNLDELNPEFADATIFSKLDARAGYWAVHLDEEGQDLTTFRTPFGRWCFKRLPFGLCVSQDLFQQAMDRILQQAPGCIGISDDVAVSGRTEEEHVRNLLNLMKQEDHQFAFEQLKQSVDADACLTYYHHDKEPVLEVDASQKGLGACLLQDDKPVAFASRTLTPTRSAYSNIERETLALVAGIQKFHTYVFGKRFKVYTDHKPLVMIINKPLTSAPPRLQRLLVKIKGYDFYLEYKADCEMMLSDTLSRLPNPENNQETAVGHTCRWLFIEGGLLGLQSCLWTYVRTGHTVMKLVFVTVFSSKVDRYYFGFCSQELAACVPPPLARPQNTRQATTSHDYCVAIGKSRLLYYIRNVNFINDIGELVNFDENGDPPARYELLNWQMDLTGKMHFKVVGAFDSSLAPENQLKVNETGIKWYSWNNQVPISICNKPCSPGTRKFARKGEPFCCFDCIPCAPGEFSNTTGPPRPFRNTSTSPGTIILECAGAAPAWAVCGLLQIALLASICLGLASKAGKMPSAANEAKFISFSMIAFFLLCFCFVPAYFSTQGKLSVVTQLFSIIATAYAFLGCIFLPKCYYIFKCKRHM